MFAEDLFHRMKLSSLNITINSLRELPQASGELAVGKNFPGGGNRLRLSHPHLSEVFSLQVKPYRLARVTCDLIEGFPFLHNRYLQPFGNVVGLLTWTNRRLIRPHQC